MVELDPMGPIVAELAAVTRVVNEQTETIRELGRGIDQIKDELDQVADAVRIQNALREASNARDNATSNWIRSIVTPQTVATVLAILAGFAGMGWWVGGAPASSSAVPIAEVP